jgi:hypothetical protein
MLSMLLVMFAATCLAYGFFVSSVHDNFAYVKTGDRDGTQYVLSGLTVVDVVALVVFTINVRRPTLLPAYRLLQYHHAGHTRRYYHKLACGFYLAREQNCSRRRRSINSCEFRYVTLLNPARLILTCKSSLDHGAVYGRILVNCGHASGKLVGHGRHCSQGLVGHSPSLTLGW